MSVTALLLAVLLCGVSHGFATSQLDATPSDHDDQWAVIVSTSRFWHNYRHSTNALAFYQMVRRSGIPDDRIILMTADNIACDPRNAYPGTVHATEDMGSDTFCPDVDTDYTGDSVSAITFLRLLAGQMPAGTPVSKLLHTTNRSNVMIYITGHSGDNFMKFHDYEFLTSYDIAVAFRRMHALGRYNRILFVSDTCQAETLYTHIDAPNVVSIASSRLGEDSLSHKSHFEMLLGNSMVDGFTSEVLRLFETKFNDKTNSDARGDDSVKMYHVPPTYSVLQFVQQFEYELVRSHVASNVLRSTELSQVAKKYWFLTDFFGSATAARDSGSAWQLL
jgi:phosphatidylinositol glycan class K